jgi:hypothetical protein
MKHLLALALLLPLPAAALTFSGTFNGVLANAQWIPTNPATPYSPEDFLGAPVTGGFAVDIPDSWLSIQAFDTYAPIAEGHASFRATVRGLDFSYTAGLLLPESTGTRLTFWTDYRPRFEGGILEFQSDSGSLVTGATPASLQVDGTTVSGMSLSFADQHVSIAFNVDITSFRFDAVAAPVPEPPLAVLMAVGMLGLGLHHRRWLRTASRKVPICTVTVSSITRP